MGEMCEIVCRSDPDRAGSQSQAPRGPHEQCGTAGHVALGCTQANSRSRSVLTRCGAKCVMYIEMWLCDWQRRACLPRPWGCGGDARDARVVWYSMRSNMHSGHMGLRTLQAVTCGGFTRQLQLYGCMVCVRACASGAGELTPSAVRGQWPARLWGQPHPPCCGALSPARSPL
jgi:hypothetical protein